MSQVFQFVLLTAVAFRLTRIVASDDWPPSKWFRVKLKDRASVSSRWFTIRDFFTCYWCLGSWMAFATFGVAAQFVNVISPVLQAVAGAVGVGALGEKLG